MACPSDSVSIGLDVRFAELFRDSGGLPDGGRIDVADDRVWVLFPESDFMIQTRLSGDPDTIELVISVAVRAPGPSLETWWDKWSIPVDRRDEVAVARHEILTGRNLILRMLDERFGGPNRSGARP